MGTLLERRVMHLGSVRLAEELRRFVAIERKQFSFPTMLLLASL